MSDIIAALPIKTNVNGDAAVKVVDNTTPSQGLAVDAAGAVKAKQFDGAGTALTSTLISGKQSLDVNVANASLNPSVGATAATPPTQATLAGGTVSTAAPTYVTGQMDPLSLTTAGALRTDSSGTTQPVSQVTSPWVTKDQADGPVTPGTVAAFSELVGGQFNTVLPTLTAAQQAAIQLDASGRVIIRPLTSAGDAVTAVQSGTWAQNLTQVNSTAVSSSNPVPAKLTSGGTDVSVVNPLPVSVLPPSGTTPIDDYKNAAAIVAGATDDHIYTALGATGLRLLQFTASASGRWKMDIAAETGVGTGTYAIFQTAFSSVATPSIVIPVVSGKIIATGVRVKVTMTNEEPTAAQNLYSTISGYSV